MLGLVAAAACASARDSSYGVVPLGDVYGTGGQGVVRVGPGRVIGDDLELREDNGCITGYYGRRPISYCRDDKSDGAEQHWSGPTGDFSVAASGGMYNVTGNLIYSGGAFPLNQSIPMHSSSGKGWDELVKHPALLVVLANLPAIQ